MDTQIAAWEMAYEVEQSHEQLREEVATWPSEPYILDRNINLN